MLTRIISSCVFLLFLYRHSGYCISETGRSVLMDLGKQLKDLQTTIYSPKYCFYIDHSLTWKRHALAISSKFAYWTCWMSLMTQRTTMASTMVFVRSYCLSYIVNNGARHALEVLSTPTVLLVFNCY